jgi:hypothetical protein
LGFQPAYHIDVDVFDNTGTGVRVYLAGPEDENKAYKLQPTPIVASINYAVGQSTGKDYSQTIYDDGTDCPNDAIETQIYQNFQLIQAARIEYYALGDFGILFGKKGPNSNSSAWWVISQVPALNKPSKPARWSPGWTLNPFKFKRYK